MKSELNSELQQALRNAVEKSVGQKMNTPKDFDILAHRISMSTHKYISPTTLKRFWHYLEESENYVPRLFTLDLLSMFVGYQNWDAYCQFSTANKTIHSDFVKSPNLYTTSLIEGDMLNLMWTPDRCVTIKYKSGKEDRLSLKNGEHITTAFALRGSSMIDPIAAKSRRFVTFGYDKNFEIYVANRLDITVDSSDAVESVSLSATSDRYSTLIYGVFAK
jgi:hypothetical protein